MLVETLEIDSSNIAKIHYDAGRELFKVEFRGPEKPEWEYEGVTRDEFHRTIQPGAEFEHSVGKAFRKIIQGPHGPGRKVSFVTCNPNMMTEAGRVSGQLEERLYC